MKEVSRAVLDSFDILDWTIEDVPIEESISRLYRKEYAG